MFGHDDKPKDDGAHEDNNQTTTVDQTVQPDKQASDDSVRDSSWQPPATVINNDHVDKTDSFTTGQTPSEPENLPDDQSKPELPSVSPHVTSPSAPTESTDSNDDLIDIKQEALGKLSPLIGHLDQTPDEKFRTLMMMIQASDDQSLVMEAYETALKIDDEKTRAQALLDIVNEINYFTQHPSKPE